jgi:DNA (cytosine-5)-methyltransferase 1
LVEAVRPPVIFGEQVAAAVTKDAWLDDLLDALEGAGYTTGAAVVPACSVGAPHIRQRVWFVARRVANSDVSGWPGATRWERPAWQERRSEFDTSMRWLVHANSNGCKARGEATSPVGYRDTVDAAGWDDFEWLLCADGKLRPIKPGARPLAYGLPEPSPAIGPYGNAIVPQVAAEVIRAFVEGVCDE